MNKSEWLWVSIRITGLVFLVMAVAAVPDAISGVYAAVMYNGIEPSASDAFQNIVKAGKAMAVKSAIQAVLYSMASIYFIKRGKLVHKVLSNECNA